MQVLITSNSKDSIINTGYETKDIQNTPENKMVSSVPNWTVADRWGFAN
jgi:hypothetical protein